MSDAKKRLSTLMDKLWKKIKDPVLQDVPKDIAACEFECNRTDCLIGEWDKCGSRKRHATV